MKRGIYRFSKPGNVEFARVHLSAGDAAPFLDRSMYEALQFLPAFEALPTESEYRATGEQRRNFTKARDHVA